MPMAMSGAPKDLDGLSLLEKGQQRSRDHSGTARGRPPPFLDEPASFADKIYDLLNSRPGVVAALVAVALLLATNLLTWHVAARLTGQQCPASVAEPPRLPPLLRDLEIDTGLVKFNSSFWDRWNNPFRAPASPETDAAWNQVGSNCMSSCPTHFYILILHPPDSTPPVHMLTNYDSSFLSPRPRRGRRSLGPYFRSCHVCWRRRPGWLERQAGESRGLPPDSLPCTS